jgi:hypothetical protein
MSPLKFLSDAPLYLHTNSQNVESRWTADDDYIYYSSLSANLPVCMKTATPKIVRKKLQTRPNSTPFKLSGTTCLLMGQTGGFSDYR